MRDRVKYLTVCKKCLKEEGEVVEWDPDEVYCGGCGGHLYVMRSVRELSKIK